MQCVNCGFENLPGAAACGRCQSAVVIDDILVVPPRASRFRMGTRIERKLNRIGGGVRGLWRLVPRWPSAVIEPLNWRALGWTIVPGLGNMRLRRRMMGLILVATWSLCLVAALACITADASSWFVSAAAVVHVAAFVSLFATNMAYERLGTRLAFGAALFFLIRYMGYSLIGGIVDQCVQPIAISDVPNSSVIASGDGLVYQGPWLRSSALRRGDLVVYAIEEQHRREFIINEGTGLDRIVGVPNDLVEVRDGVLYVNGLAPPAEHSPLGPVRLRELKEAVQSGCYVIFPSFVHAYGHGMAPDAAIAAMCRVQQCDIRGRVLWRVSPISRIGRVR